MNAPKRRNKISIAIPASIVSEYNHLRKKTEVIGKIGRAAAIFRVDEIIIYPAQPDESMLLKYILGYMETPQYLRQYIYKVRPELQYVGILPPLRTKHHPLKDQESDIEVGDIREGVVTEPTNNGYLVDVGVQRLIEIQGKAPNKGTRTTIKITKKDPQFWGITAKRNRIPDYWGYTLRASKRRLSDLVHSPEFDLKIATSKMGSDYNDLENQIQSDWSEAARTLIVFGSFKQGVHEIVRRERKRAEEIFDYIVNTVPYQGSETIRTEEAIIVSLAILNMLKD